MLNNQLHLTAVSYFLLTDSTLSSKEIMERKSSRALLCS